MSALRGDEDRRTHTGRRTDGTDQLWPPDDITDPKMPARLVAAIDRGNPSPENQMIRARNTVVMRSFTMLLKTMRGEGVLEPELRELMRERIATSWDRLFGIPACHY
jgi:hypothetical protein